WLILKECKHGWPPGALADAAHSHAANRVDELGAAWACRGSPLPDGETQSADMIEPGERLAERAEIVLVERGQQAFEHQCPELFRSFARDRRERADSLVFSFF